MAFLVGGDVWPRKRRKTNMTKSVSQTTVKDVFTEEFKKEIKLIPANSVQVSYNTQILDKKLELFLFVGSVLLLGALSVKFLL